METFSLMPRRHSPVRTRAVALVLALGAGACRRADVPGAAGTRAGDAAITPATAAALGATSSSQGSGIEFYPAAQLARMAASLGSSTGRTFGDQPTYKYIEGRRTADGVPEVHDRWIDLALVQAGRAVLLAGGRVEGGRLESPGEHRGGTIVGGTEHPIAAGDFCVIPAGVPHQYRVAPGDTLRYLTIKVVSAGR